MYVPKLQINGVEVDRPNPENGEGLQPSYNSNPIVDVLSENAAIGNINHRNINPKFDWERFEKYGAVPNAINTEDEIRRNAAKYQSNWEKFGNMLIQGIGNELVIGTLKAFSDLYDIGYSALTKEGHIGSYVNPIGQDLEKLMDYNREQFEIFLKNPEKSFDVTDFGWYANGLVSAATTASLFIPGIAVEKALGLAAKGIKIATGLNKELSIVGNAIMKSKRLRAAAAAGKVNRLKTINALDAATSLGINALTSRTIEGRQEAREVYRNNYNRLIDELSNMSEGEYAEFLDNNKGRDYENMGIEDIAKDIAEIGAFDTFKNDYAMLLMDVLQYAGINKLFSKKLFGKMAGEEIRDMNKQLISNIGKGSTEYLQQFSAKNLANSATNSIKNVFKNGISATAKSKMFILGMEGISEGFEEGYQGIMSEIGKTTMDKMIDPTVEYRGLDSYLKDPAIWEQAFWGSIGSLVFTGLGAAYNKISKEVYIKKHKDKLSENDVALLRMGYETSRVKELEGRIAKTDKVMKRLSMINDGLNPYKPIFDAEGKPTGEYETLDDINKQLYKQRVLDEYLLDLYTGALNHNNADLITEFVNSNEFQTAMAKALGNIEGSSVANINILDRFNKLVAQYDDTMYALSNKYETKNPFAVMATAEHIMNSTITRDMAADMVKYEEGQLTKNDATSNRAKQYAIDVLQAELEKVEREIKNTDTLYVTSDISKNVRDVRIRQLKKYRNNLIKEIREQEGLSVLDEYSKEIDALNISDETYNNIKNALVEFRKKMAVDDTVNDEDNKHARNRAEFMVEKVKYDSFIPKLNKEYEEAYNDIAYSMDMGIANKLKQDFENVKEFILNSENPVKAYYKIMSQDKDFMDSIDENLRDSIYALKLGSDIFSGNPEDIFTGSHTNRFRSRDRELLYNLAIEKQKENDRQVDTKSDTTPLTEEQEKDEVIDNPEQVQKSDEPLPTPKPALKKEEKKEEKGTEKKEEKKEEKKTETKREKSKKDNIVFIPSTGEEVIIDDDYIINDENPIIDDQSYVTYVESMSIQNLAETAMQKVIRDTYKKLDAKSKETLAKVENYEETTAYNNLMNDLMKLSDGYNLFTNIKDESVRKNAINKFIKSYLNSLIKIYKTTPAEAIEKSKINRSMQETISAVDAAINAYSASGTIGENVTEEIKTPAITKDINSQIEQLITNYIDKRKIITIKDKDGKTIIDTVSLLKTILFVEKEGISYEDKSLVFQEIYRYIQKSLYDKENTKYSFYNSNIIYYVEDGKRKFKDTVTLMNDLINDRYVEVRDRMSTMDSIMRVSGTTAFSEEERKQKNAIISRLINNPKEWDNVSIVKDGTTIKFLYKGNIEIGFLQEVAKDETNNILYKVKNIFDKGRMLNNKGFVFDIDSNNKAKVVDDYFHALINAASGLSNDADAKQLFDILIKQNISRNTDNAILNYMKDEDINIAKSVLNNGLVKNLRIGDMDGGDAYYGAVDVQLNGRVKVKVVYTGKNTFNFVYYTKNGEVIITSEDKDRYNRIAVAVANNIIQDTNTILLHNYNKIKANSEVYEDSIEYTYESLLASYETFKEINYRNMAQQVELQKKLIDLKEGEKVDFEVLGFEGERLQLDAERPAEFSDVSTSINPINNPIVIQTSAGVVTESGTTLSYINPDVHSSDIGILLSDVNNIMNPQILWLSNNDMNYLYNENTPVDTNDTSKRQLADAVKTEIHNLLYTYLVGDDGNASTRLDSSRFEEFTTKLSSLLGGRNSSRGGLFTGVDIIRKWNNEKGGSIAIKFDNEEIVKDENGEYNYEVVIITGSQNSTIREPRIILRDESGKKSYALKANIDSLTQLILNHIKFNKSHFTFKNTDGNVGNETDYWYKKDGKLHINIGNYKPVYDNYGAFLMNNNAAKLRVATDDNGNIIKLAFPISGRTPSFTINFGEFITKQRTSSPVEGEHTYDRTAIDELLNKDKEEGTVSVRELLENTDTNDEYIDMLFGKNSYNVKILADTVKYDKDGMHYARYDKDTNTIYIHKNMFDGADGASNPSAFIRRQLIHENIHRTIKYNNIRYDDKLINDLLDTFKATIEALAKDDSKFGKSIKRGMDDVFHIVYDANGSLDIDKTIDKFIKDIHGENNNLSKNEAIIKFVEEWLVESITQSNLISYLADTKFVLNGQEIEVKDTKKSQSIFQKIVDVLLKLFGIDLRDREKNSIFAQQYKLLNSMNPDAIDGKRKSTKRTTRKKSDNKSKKETTTKRGRKKKEEVKDNVQTEIQFTDDTNTENNEVKEGTNTEEGTVVAVPNDDVGDNTPEIFDPDNMYNDYTRDDNNDDAGYNNNDDEGSLYSNSKDILFTDEEIVINNYANNPTYNPNGVVTVSKMDNYLSMFPIEERALVAQNLENGNVNYVCR